VFFFQEPETPKDMALRSPTLLLPLICLLILLVYWPGLSGGYVFDDFPNIVHNDNIRMEHLTPGALASAAFSSGSGPLSRPLSMASFALERHFFGLAPFPMKLTNLLIHVVNTLLGFLLLRALISGLQSRHPERVRLLVSPQTLALLVATAWALAPINLTGVLYVVQRMESLATLFMLAGLLAYVHGRNLVDQGQARRGWSWLLGGLCFGGGLGVLAKETAVMLPLYALLIEWLLFGLGKDNPIMRKHLLRLYGLILVLPGIAALLLYLPGILSGSAYAHRPFTLEERLWTQAHVLWHYLYWIVAPSPGALTLYHDSFPVVRGLFQPWTTLLAVAGLAGLLLGTLKLRRSAPLLTLGILWFFAMHLLVSTALPLEMVYEHRNYLPSLGVFLAVLGLLFTGRDGDSLILGRQALATGLIVIYGFLTFLRANEWSDPVQLAYFEATRQSESPRANHDLGMVLAIIAPDANSIQFSQAMASFAYAASLPNSTLTPLQALVFEHGKHGLPVNPQWWDDMREYVRTNPLSAQDLSALRRLVDAQASGVIRVDTEELGRLIREAYSHHPRRAILATLLANYLLNVAGEAEEAGKYLHRAVALAPRSSLRWAHLIQYQILMGQLSEAHVSLERLQELNSLGRLNDLIADLDHRLALATRAANHRDSRP